MQQDTSKVTDMSSMFYECYALTALDLSSFDTSKIETIKNMFNGCTKLATIYVKDKDTFVPATITDESNKKDMFKDCLAQEFTNIADKQ